MPVASHFVIGAPHAVLHAVPSARLLRPPRVEMIVAVHPMLQLLAVLRAHEEEEEDKEVAAEDGISDAGFEGPVSSSGPISLKATNIDFRSFCRPSTV